MSIPNDRKYTTSHEWVKAEGDCFLVGITDDAQDQLGDLDQNVLLAAENLTREYLQAQLRDRPREVFALLLLDNQHRVIQFVELFYGTLDTASVWPREIVQIALKHNAAAVILAHNHPSGVAEPSRADRQITDRILAALALVDIRVLDHLVIGDGITVSFAERGWL